MTIKWKRHERIKNNPENVRFEDAQNWLLSFGFIERVGRGSHKVFTHPSWNGRPTMQSVKGKAKSYQARQPLTAIAEIHNV